MTATKMLNRFRELLNQPNNDSVRSDRVAVFLSMAQQGIFDDLYNNYIQQQLTGRQPANDTQNSQQNDESLQPFKRNYPDPTYNPGVKSFKTLKTFLPYPRDLVHLAKVMAVKPKDDCPDQLDYQIAKWDNPNSIVPSDQNPMYGATWEPEDLDPAVYWYNPRYFITTQGGVQGIKMYPEYENGKNLEYDLVLIYYINPPEIRIKTPDQEVRQYAGTPNFVQVMQDQSSLFPDYLHGQIVRKAVQMFSESVTDYTAVSTEQQLINTGVN